MGRTWIKPERYLHLGWFPPAEPVRVRIDGAPEYLRGLRTLFVSDVHLRRQVSEKALAALIALLRAQEARLLLLGGDYGETAEDCVRLMDALGTLDFPLGAYAVMGNNDARSMDMLRASAERAGIALLRNEARRITLSGGALEIGGCDEHKYGEPRTRGLFETEDAYRILLSHYPCAPECACELMLSGHTHGGQFNFFGLTPYALGYEARFGLMELRGLHRRGNMRLLVGNGIGVSGLPLRIGAAAQIYLLEFVT